MVRAPVDAVDDGVGCAFQFVVQAALDQSSEDRLCGLVAVKGEASDVGLVTQTRHSAVHGLADVAADAESRRAGSRPGSGSTAPGRPARRDRGVRVWRRDRSSTGVVRNLRWRSPDVGRRRRHPRRRCRGAIGRDWSSVPPRPRFPAQRGRPSSAVSWTPPTMATNRRRPFRAGAWKGR
jgi:hypothetical protein